MPAGQGNDRHINDAEVFSSAVERGVHPGYAGDADLARDLGIVALLRAGQADLDPRPDERARARARVLARLAAAEDPIDHAPPQTVLTAEPDRPAATALLTAEPAPAGDELGARRSRRSGRHTMPTGGATDGARRRPPIGGRVVMVAAAAVLGTAVIGGAGVLASGDALPGDNLYAVKRAAEAADLAMTWDDTERGRQHLDLASTRIDEMEQLVARDPQTAPDPEVYRAALRDFDDEADQGSQLLLADEDVPREQTEADLQSWASGQAERLASLRSSLPGPAASEAAGSLDRLDQLTGPDPLDSTSECAVDGCVGGSGDPTVAPEGTATDATGDPTEAGSAPTTGSTGQPGTTARRPSGTQQDGQPGPLPDVLPENPLGGVLGGSGDQPETTAPNSSGGGNGSGGGLPPIQVPPLLPGVGGVSIG